MLMPLKRFDEGGEKGDEPFCADAAYAACQTRNSVC